MPWVLSIICPLSSRMTAGGAPIAWLMLLEAACTMGDIQTIPTLRSLLELVANMAISIDMAAGCCCFYGYDMWFACLWCLCVCHCCHSPLGLGISVFAPTTTLLPSPTSHQLNSYIATHRNGVYSGLSHARSKVHGPGGGLVYQ